MSFLSGLVARFDRATPPVPARAAPAPASVIEEPSVEAANTNTEEPTETETAGVGALIPVETPQPAEPVAAERSGAAVLTAELVGGLRSAGRQLARPSAAEGHLRTELTIAARHIDSVIRADNAYDQPWAIAAMSLIHDAGAALEQRRITDGWQLLRAAQTELIEGLDRRSLAVERAKVTGTPLVLDDSTDIEVLRSEVWAMCQTRNTYHAELDRRLFEAARGLNHRAWVLVLVLVLGAIGVFVSPPSGDAADALGSITAYLTIVGLAMTGAAISQVLFTNNSRRASAIAEVANPLSLVLLRMAFGGVVGLIIVVLLRADIQNLINVTALSAYPWAIFGGFSERYVDRMIDRVEADAHVAADEACRASAGL